MAVKFSRALTRRIHREVERAMGSHPIVRFYTGEAPMHCDDPPTGHCLEEIAFSEDGLDALEERPTDLVAYWRIYDGAGIAIMQGDWV